MDNISKVCAYARFSSVNQRVESIETQLEIIKKYCEKKGYEIVATFTDEAKTGTSDNREGFLQMIEESKQKKWEAIILYSLDRFGRNAVNHYYYKSILDEYNIKIIAVLDGIEGAETAETSLMENIKIGLAEYYSAHLSKVILDSCIMTSRNKLKAGGVDNLGFDTVDQKYYINEEEAKLVRHIFDLALEGNTQTEIAKILNAEGYSSKKGNMFSRTSIDWILRNEKYDGKLVYNVYKRKPKLTSKKLRRVKKPDSEHVKIPDAIPRIIEHNKFVKVQEMLGELELYKKKYKDNPCYLLSGIVYCSKCGSRYHTEIVTSGRNKIKKAVYRCQKHHSHYKEEKCDGKSINAEYLINYSIKLIDEILLVDNAKKRIEDAIKEKINLKKKEQKVHLKSLQEKLRDQNDEIDKLSVVAQQSSGVARDSLMKAIQSKMDDSLNLQISINEIKTKLDTKTDIQLIDLDEVITRYKEARETKNITEIRRILLDYMKRINLSDSSVEFLIDYRGFTLNYASELIESIKCERKIIAFNKF